MYNYRTGRLIIWLLVLFAAVKNAYSQIGCTDFVIHEINVKGNEKTKASVILFESGLHARDKIEPAALLKRISEAEANVKRTGLFSSVIINYQLDIDSFCTVNITIQVVENWLLFPMIIFELVDRNFNIWYKDFKHDLSRTSIGLGLTHYNLTGRKDQLKFKVAGGYTDKYELIFIKPYIGRSRNIDAGVRVSYLEYSEAAYDIKNSKPVFYSKPGTNNLLRKQAGTKIRMRTDRRNAFSEELEWTENITRDSIAILQPDYFLEGRTRQNLLKAISTYEFNALNDPVRPTNGFYIKSTVDLTHDVERRSYLNLQTQVEFVYSFTQKWFYRAAINASTALIRTKPAINLYSGIGLGNNLLNGYDLYLINAMDFVIGESQINYKVFDFNRSLIKFLRNEPKIKLNIIVDLFIKASTARANDPYYQYKNTLSNTNLGSISIGAQWTINSIIKADVNYAVNHLGERGFYFHTTKAF
ncbi:MAG: BamA/TamA family outer membrane protein [Saprospiraceae bacterium]|nr:BamA/TamA family outer membrane protein [Saprospiraceae bacterium]HMW37943.1 BamA/TamA family outer membrane protein [Saprospiraceae bacterium]HMX87617.1 BamA/TamA family outer membrane protein [Saprospiraceae bacterium]HMZ39432.1 BamA/TamA family outer membrane protein [Saprospiraceae bacterium]HNA63672.1 BamA/TamA family outer membrane protein [Saprospiraceae bacterium]